MIDYLIVGSGLAGIAFAETALENKKSILVFDNNSQQSSKVAGGLYNPVILKRFSEVWEAQEQISLLNSFYSKLEKKLDAKFDFKIPIYRKLFSVEEQNNWFIATDKIGLAPFLSSKLVAKKYDGIDSPFNYGEVLQTGYVDTEKLLTNYHQFLENENLLLREEFDYSLLEINSDFVQYKNIKAKNIIFAEGFGMMANPYFSKLPLDGTKGELLIIKVANLNLDVVIKTSVFILPLENDLYKVGATYNWKDKTNLPTEEGRQELLENLKEILNCDFEIIEHLAGVRPTVKDRRPMIGTHPNHKRIHLLNGLGTRGVMLAPAMAKALFENLEFEKPLDKTIDIKRFRKVQW
ncbi:FAD-dependent oxidoreductase [uncultured Flavobacterium sp.]|uniref:NAD(P)/FAD-dependent oxidoreductase n=1 Tax=uncultured Flavobacterium sp. TaxID=165435 RepID=UPI0025EBBDC2|nr:FAD-dependent oxidoreductase [uncultured Flavobacterium sp.]